MAPRPYWKGHLKLSLVSCPIALYPAVDASERISFRQVNRATGNRLRQQLVDSVTGDAVESHEKARGYEIAESQFAIVEDEELEKARAEARTRPYGPTAAPAAPMGEQEIDEPPHRMSKREEFKRVEVQSQIFPSPRPRIENPRTIEIERFIPRAQIDARYYHTPYYIAPRDKIGQEAFAVIRDSIASKEVVGMGHVVLSNRERPIIVEPLGLGLRGITLRYAHEIRNEAEYFADIPQMALPEQMVSLAEHIVAAKLTDFDPAYLEDRYRAALLPVLRDKQIQVPQRAGPAVPSKKNIIDLMEVLQRSLAAEKPPTQRKAHRLAPRRAVAASAKAAPTKSSKIRPRHSR
jgi:DNA end-binding protein Ku